MRLNRYKVKSLVIFRHCMVVLCLVNCFKPNAEAQGQNRLIKSEKNLKNNVVAIQVNFSDGSSEDGFGFIVGEKNNRFFINTSVNLTSFIQIRNYLR